MASSFEDDFRDVFGDPARESRLAELGEAALHRIMRRAQHAAERDGRSVKGVDRGELAMHIAEALRRGDEPRARQLIEAGAGLFGSDALVAEVTEQSRQLELDALRAAQEAQNV